MSLFHESFTRLWHRKALSIYLTMANSVFTRQTDNENKQQRQHYTVELLISRQLHSLFSFHFASPSS